MPVTVTVSDTVPGLGYMLDETGAQILDEAGEPISGAHPAGTVTITVTAPDVTITVEEQ